MAPTVEEAAEGVEVHTEGGAGTLPAAGLERTETIAGEAAPAFEREVAEVQQEPEAAREERVQTEAASSP